MENDSARPWEFGWRVAAMAGDPVAWRALYDSAFATVAAYARWRGGSTELAQDIIQESWLVAARRLASFDPHRGTFADWVCGIAANVARNLVRKRLKHSARVRSLVGAAEPAFHESEPSNDPERVARALAELPDRYEMVLRAKYFEQRSVAEIAANRGESEKAIESLLTRARQAFRECYERRGEAP